MAIWETFRAKAIIIEKCWLPYWNRKRQYYWEFEISITPLENFFTKQVTAFLQRMRV